MAFEKMGFDLTLWIYVVLGNSALITFGAVFSACLTRKIKGWQQAAAATPCEDELCDHTIISRNISAANPALPETGGDYSQKDKILSESPLFINASIGNVAQYPV